MPPGLLLAWQLVMVASFGVLGVLAAQPLLAVVIVVVEDLYVERDRGRPSGCAESGPPHRFAARAERRKKMAKSDLATRLREAFARLNERIDASEDAVLSHQWTGSKVLASELAQALAMLDFLSTRIGTLPASDRAGLEEELSRLRRRWGDAKEAYDVGQTTGGELRAEDEKNSRAALDEVQNGLLKLISEMNARYAGHAPAPTP
jgi:hypothetical protein